MNVIKYVQVLEKFETSQMDTPISMEYHYLNYSYMSKLMLQKNN